MRSVIVIICFLVMCLNCNSCLAVEPLEDYSQLDKAWDGQEAVSDKDFEDAINVLQEKKNKTDKKKRIKLIKKISGGGTSLHNNLKPDSEINNMVSLSKNSNGMLLNVPVNLIVEDVPLEKGFYKIIAKKDDNGDLYFLFYQSQFFKGKIRASETSNDYGEKEIDFIKLIPYNERFVKIIYGSIDYNAYAYARFVI